MKWSSKSFALQLIFAFLGTLTLTVIINQVLIMIEGHQDKDFTLQSIFIAGLGYPWIHAFVGGWKNLNPKALFLVCVIIAGLFTGKPATAILGVTLSILLYLVAHKLRNIIKFYQVEKSDTPPSTLP